MTNQSNTPSTPYTLQTIFLSACEELCNRALQYDQSSLKRIADLDGKTIKISTVSPSPSGPQDFNFYLHFTHQGLIFSSLMEKQYDTLISASSLHLILKFIRLEAISDDYNIQIDGDKELVKQLQAILKYLDIDWEEALSKISGDIVAHEIGNIARGVKSWFKGRRKSLKENLKDFIQEGVNNTSKVPDQNEINSFIRDVQELNKQTGKVQARIDSLETTLDTNSLPASNSHHKE